MAGWAAWLLGSHNQLDVCWLRSQAATLFPDSLIRDLENFPDEMLENLIFKLQSDR